jgi:putative serine protease PepD
MGPVSEYDERDPAAPDTPEGAAGAPVDRPDDGSAMTPAPAAPAPAAPAAASSPADLGQAGQAPTAAPDASADDEPTVTTGLGWPGTSDTDDTRPIGWTQTAPPAGPAAGPQGTTYGQPFAGQPAGPYAWPTAAYPTDYAGQPARPTGSVPGWLWPVVAGLALMVGLLGGTLGGVAVSRSLGNDGSITIPSIDSDSTLPPLEADNGSIAAVAAQLLPSTVQILAMGGADGESGGGATGSGFVLDDQGHVITNNHVVAGATGAGEITVVDHKGEVHDAQIVGRSAVYDIAVLDVEDAGALKAAALGSSRAMRVGESVVAIGSPLGLSSTVTSGIVSALDRPVTTASEDEASYINAVQTDAAINPGNSGGPLVNMRGQVIGVNSAIATTGGAFGGESGNIGVGFAIPMEQVRVTAAQILATGEAKYPVIGANVNTGPQQDGAEVVDVPSGTPADIGGLREGDVVVAVNDKQITDGIGLIVAIRSHQPGETIRLTVRRDGSSETVKVRLDAKVG